MLQVANRKLASLSDVLFTGLGRALGFLRPLARGLPSAVPLAKRRAVAEQQLHDLHLRGDRSVD